MHMKVSMCVCACMLVPECFYNNNLSHFFFFCAWWLNHLIILGMLIILPNNSNILMYLFVKCFIHFLKILQYKYSFKDPF